MSSDDVIWVWLHAVDTPVRVAGVAVTHNSPVSTRDLRFAAVAVQNPYRFVQAERGRDTYVGAQSGIDVRDAALTPIYRASRASIAAGFESPRHENSFLEPRRPLTQLINSLGRISLREVLVEFLARVTTQGFEIGPLCRGHRLISGLPLVRIALQPWLGIAHVGGGVLRIVFHERRKCKVETTIASTRQH
jgi:hypothetical protein